MNKDESGCRFLIRNYLPNMLVRVVAPHFVAGLVLENDIVVRAAPILKWAKGKDRDWLRTYFQQKGWIASVVSSKSIGLKGTEAIDMKLSNKVVPRV
jgi:hypothetical protein